MGYSKITTQCHVYSLLLLHKKNHKINGIHALANQEDKMKPRLPSEMPPLLCKNHKLPLPHPCKAKPQNLG